MKFALAAAAVVAALAFGSAPQTAEAGGLHKLCPITYVKGHYVEKKVVKKKVAYKAPAKKKVAYKAPAKKKVVVKKAAKKPAAKKPLK